MSDETLTRIDADGGAIVVLNRPELHNPFDAVEAAAGARKGAR
jgi:hypothetical protein